MTPLLLTLLLSGAAQASEPMFEAGLGGGAVVPFGDDELRPAWLITVHTALWFDARIAVEGRLGLSGARARTTGRPYLAEYAQLSLVADLLPAQSQSRVHPLVHAGAGLLHVGQGADRLTGYGSLGAGLLVPLIGPVALRLDAGALVHGDGDDGLRASFDTGLSVVVRTRLSRDRDKDQLRDRLDGCPTEPEDLDGFEDLDGCPDDDNDEDGVPDVLDGCPTEPETPDGVEDFDGCPERDDDGDGILGKRDRCPNEPEDVDGIEDHDGCPEQCIALLPPEQGGDPTNFAGCPPDM
jgi:hypothetical protein